MKMLVVLRWLGVWLIVAWLVVMGVSWAAADVVLIDQGGGKWIEATPGKVFSGQRVVWLTDASKPDDPDDDNPGTDLAKRVGQIVSILVKTDRGRQTAAAVALAYETTADAANKFDSPASMADFAAAAVKKSIDLVTGADTAAWTAAAAEIRQEVLKIDAKTPLDTTAKLAAVYKEISAGLKSAAQVKFVVDGGQVVVVARAGEAIDWDSFLKLLLELLMKLLLEWLS